MDSIIQFIAPTEIAVTLTGRATDRRQPVHLIFLIDTSESMGDSAKLASVKRSLEFIQPLLTPEDLVSMISFGEESTILLNKVIATEKESILYKINTLRTEGCTNMSAGLMNVRDCLLPADDNRKQGVLLLTDGHANRGINDSAGLKALVQSLLTERPTLTITTVGYGDDHNANLLHDIGTTGGGSYNLVYNLENVATVFGEVLGGLTTVVAQNVIVHLPPGSIPKTAYTTVTGQDGTVQVRIGDIYTENEIVVLASLAPGQDTVRVTGHNMMSFTTQTDTIVASPILQELQEQIPKHVEQAVFRYRVGQVLKAVLDQNTNRSPNGHLLVPHRGAQGAEALKKESEDLLAQLKGLSYASEQLIQMMIDDLERVQETFDNGADHDATAMNLTQHSAFLGLGRGLRSIIPEDPHDPCTTPPLSQSHLDPYDITPQSVQSVGTRSANIDATFSPFSNRRQRIVRTSMRDSLDVREYE